MSERVFVDTSAVARAHQFSLEGADLFTSNYVVVETHTLILNRLGHDIAVQVLEHLYASATRIIRATETDERRGREIVVQRRDKAYSLVDAISFAIMEQLHLRLAWSYDQHFRQYGSTLER